MLKLIIKFLLMMNNPSSKFQTLTKILKLPLLIWKIYVLNIYVVVLILYKPLHILVPLQLLDNLITLLNPFLLIKLTNPVIKLVNNNILVINNNKELYNTEKPVKVPLNLLT